MKNKNPDRVRLGLGLGIGLGREIEREKERKKVRLVYLALRVPNSQFSASYFEVSLRLKGGRQLTYLAVDHQKLPPKQR
jgi:hypothetical protein